jgi:hypothetical protein
MVHRPPPLLCYFIELHYGFQFPYALDWILGVWISMLQYIPRYVHLEGQLILEGGAVAQCKS